MGQTISHEDLRISEGARNVADVDSSATIGADAVMDPSAIVHADAKLGDRVRLCAWSSVGERARIDSDVVLDRGVQVEDGASVVNRTPGTRGMVPAYAIVRAGETCELENGQPVAPERLGRGSKHDFPSGGEPIGPEIGTCAPAPPDGPEPVRGYAAAQKIDASSRIR